MTLSAVAKPGIWQLWLRADRQEADSTERSLLFRRLLRENGYVVPGGERRAGPVCEVHGAACEPVSCL
jgi:hypothetical protein